MEIQFHHFRPNPRLPILRIQWSSSRTEIQFHHFRPYPRLPMLQIQRSSSQMEIQYLRFHTHRSARTQELAS